MKFIKLSNKELIILSVTLIILLFFTFMPFYDQSNLIAILWISSHFYNFKPPFSNVGWPGGPFFIIIWIPAYLAYMFTGFNLMAAIITWKLLLLVLFIGFSIIIVQFVNPDKRLKLFIFTCLNPAMILFTLIWIQFDIIPIFFFTLSLYLIRNKEVSENLPDTILSLSPMFIAIFTTYYPVIFIPLLIIYAKNKIQRINLLLGSIILGALFGLADILFYRGFSFSYISNLNGNGLSSSFYEGLQLFITIPLEYYIIFLAILIIIIPIILKKYGFGLYTSSFVLLLIFLYSSASAGFDTYLWLFPFTILAVLERKEKRPKILHMFVLNIPIFIEALFSNFIMGTGIQQGIFYFGYAVFHINYLFVRTAAQFQYFVLIFNSMLMTSVVSVIIIILFLNYGNSRDKRDVENTTSKPYSPSLYLYINKIKVNKKFTKRLFLLLLISMIIMAPISIIFNGQYNSINDQKPENFPNSILNPTYKPGTVDFAMAVNNITYVTSDQTATIFTSSPILGFYRGLCNSYIHLNLSLHILNNTYGQQHSILQSSLFNLSTYSTILPNLTNFNDSNKVNNYYNNDELSSSNETFNNKMVKIVYLNGDQGFSYHLQNNESNYKYIILFQSPPENINTPKTLWYVSNNNDTAAVSLIFIENSIILAYGNHAITIPFSPSILNNGLNYFLFYSNLTSLSVNINGFNTTICSNFFSSHNIFNNSIMNIGYPSGASNNEYNYIGNVSLLYDTNEAVNYSSYHYVVLQNNINSSTKINLGSNKSIDLDLFDSLQSTNLLIEGHMYLFNYTLTNLTFGKLSTGNWGLIITLNSFSLISRSDNGYYLVPIFYFSIFPYILIGILSYYIIIIKKTN